MSVLEGLLGYTLSVLDGGEWSPPICDNIYSFQVPDALAQLMKRGYDPDTSISIIRWGQYIDEKEEANFIAIALTRLGSAPRRLPPKPLYKIGDPATDPALRKPTPLLGGARASQRKLSK